MDAIREDRVKYVATEAAQRACAEEEFDQWWAWNQSVTRFHRLDLGNTKLHEEVFVTEQKTVDPVTATSLTSAAGFPANDTHSSSISLSSVVTRKSPCTILGGSGGTRTVRDANFERMPGSPARPGPTWHWYRASSSSITGKISREKSPATRENTERSKREVLLWRSTRGRISGYPRRWSIFRTVRWHAALGARAGMRGSWV